jgi:hypothetical protein
MAPTAKATGGADKAAQASKDQAAAKQGPSITVKTLPGVARFCRGGLCFGPEPTTIAVADLGKAALDAIKAEPKLIVEVVQE